VTTTREFQVCFPWGEYPSWDPGGINTVGPSRIGTRTWSGGFLSQAADALACMHFHEDAGSGAIWPSSVWDFNPPGTCGVPAYTRYYESGGLGHGQWHDHSVFFGWTAHGDKFMKAAHYLRLSDIYYGIFIQPVRTVGLAYPGDPYGVGEADSWFHVGDPMIVPDPARGQIVSWDPSGFNQASRKALWADFDTIRFPDLGLSWSSQTNIPGGPPMEATIQARWDIVRIVEPAYVGDPFDRQVAGVDFVDDVITAGSVFYEGTLSGVDEAPKVTTPLTIDLNLARETILGWYEGGDDIAIRIELNALSDSVVDYIQAEDDFADYGSSWGVDLLNLNEFYLRARPECVDALVEYFIAPPLRMKQRDDGLGKVVGNAPRLPQVGPSGSSRQSTKNTRLNEGQSYL
jgi:hypothetical protein